MKSVFRYDDAGAPHEAPATVDAVEAALIRLDNKSQTSVVVKLGELETLQKVLAVYGHITGSLVCCWTHQTAYDVEFQRWLLGPSVAEGEIEIRVWGADTALPARYGVSAEAVRSCMRSLLAGEDLKQCGAWEDTL